MYGFKARLAGDALVLTFDGHTYRLTRHLEPASDHEAEARDEREALARALRWLKRHQSDDGSWSADAWRERCPAQPGCFGPGTDLGAPRFHVGVTALATLALLRGGDRGRAVERAVAWLCTQQAPDGAIGIHSDGADATHNHAWATHALAVAAVALDDAAARGAALDAVDYCVAAQNPGLGWKYGVRTGRNDTAVTTAMTEALHAARSAGIALPETVFEGVTNWVVRVTDSEGNVGYETPGGGSSFLAPTDGKFDLLPVMTAAGIVALRRAEPDADVKARAGVLRGHRPEWSPRRLNFYYWYYGTRASALSSAPDWRDWRAATVGALVPNQRRGGCASGSWDVVDEWGLAGGRVYATALNALTLTVTLERD